MLDFYFHPFFWAISALLLIQWGIYLFLFRRLAFYKISQPSSQSLPPVSIIMAAHNEEENLRHFLPVLLDQDYPVFEVIVIDDQSEDESAYLLEDLCKIYAHLKVVSIKEHIREFAGKKLALTLGIKAASYDVLLFTDADCVPASPEWIRKMMEGYHSKDTQFVLGYSPYHKKPGVLNAFIRFDTFITALQYLSMALAGNPYMGVGRNLSYRKKLFFDNKGFAPYLKVSSGDDDLFVNSHANSHNTSIQLSPESFVFSEPKGSWGAWLSQKRRHIQVGKLYKAGHKRMLGFIWLSHFFFLASVIAACIIIKPFWIGLAVYALRLMVQLPIYYSASRKLKLGSLWAAMPLLEIPYQLFFLPLMGLLSLFVRKRKKW